jgi:hypothetical protein
VSRWSLSTTGGNALRMLYIRFVNAAHVRVRFLVLRY